MKKPLPLLIGSVLCVNAALNSFGAAMMPRSHDSIVQKLFGISVALAEEAAVVHYTCPMHPQIILDKPGKCPICGMDLVQIAGSAPSHAHEEKRGTLEKTVLSITADTIQKMGVRTEKVTKGSSTHVIQATAIIMENERSRRDLFSQIEGRVENLRYGAVGDRVKKGDLFYLLSSPELLSLQNDFIAARKGGLQDLAQAAQKRMMLLGVDDKVIADLSKRGKAFDKVPFYIPADGVLAELNIRNGYYLNLNDRIGLIEDLSTLWLDAAVPENEVGAIKAGDVAEITVGLQKYEGRVDYIYPFLDSEARTGKVRLALENKDGMLRPSSYARVVFASGQTMEHVTIPSEAVLRSSEGDHAIVALGNGKFQARNIQTGSAHAGRTEITSGLKEGDDVVVSAQFLIDSESSLRESLGKLSGRQ